MYSSLIEVAAEFFLREIVDDISIKRAFHRHLLLLSLISHLDYASARPVGYV